MSDDKRKVVSMRMREPEDDKSESDNNWCCECGNQTFMVFENGDIFCPVCETTSTSVRAFEP